MTEKTYHPKDGALPVSGYKPQTESKVNLVNHLKAEEERILRAFDALKMGRTLIVDAPAVEVDHRWLAIARTHLEQAFMAANRAVFQPGRVELPWDALYTFDGEGVPGPEVEIGGLLTTRSTEKTYPVQKA